MPFIEPPDVIRLYTDILDTLPDDNMEFEITVKTRRKGIARAIHNIASNNNLHMLLCNTTVDPVHIMVISTLYAEW